MSIDELELREERDGRKKGNITISLEFNDLLLLNVLQVDRGTPDLVDDGRAKVDDGQKEEQEGGIKTDFFKK